MRKDIHGSYSTYWRLGCRCEKCKMANRDHQRRYRAKVKAAAGMRSAAAPTSIERKTMNTTHSISEVQ